MAELTAQAFCAQVANGRTGGGRRKRGRKPRGGVHSGEQVDLDDEDPVAEVQANHNAVTTNSRKMVWAVGDRAPTVSDKT